MQSKKIPLSLRSPVTQGDAAGSLALVVMAASAVGSAAAQEGASQLPAVTVDAPVTRSRPVAARPSQAQVRARTAIRRQARQRQQTPVAAPIPSPASSLPTFAQLPDGNPYADAAAPYKVDRLASSRFTQPILDTPKTVTVLTKEVLRDKNATSLKDAARTTAGVTLGTGEGGNAFGDRFFIRGFDARNDVFIDGIRDPAVSIRENFFTEQVEILRGPASTYAGRGTAGGAINIVTKQARADKSFGSVETTVGTDQTRRVTVDVNRVLNPTLAVRLGALEQRAHVAGRDVITDNRAGAYGAVKWTPTESMTFTANAVHTELTGIPDFGVPYYRPSQTVTGAPFPEVGARRSNFYGLANRDRQTARQDFGTLTGEVRLNDWMTVSNRFRVERSLLDYIGTLPQAPVVTNANPALWTLTASPQSRRQVTDVVANQTDLTMKYDAGGFRNTTVAGVELSRERVSINNYSGLTSEAFGGGFTGNGAITGVNIFNPQYTYLPFPNFSPVLGTNPTIVPVNTKAGYVIHTANYRDFIILNGGLRYDDYSVTSSNNTGSNAVKTGMFNYNVGVTVKPLPNASVYAAYATSSNPVGAELDATGAAYGGLAAVSNVNQVFGPERNKSIEIGTKWELFDRHILATAALFQTEKENARELATINGVANTIVAGGSYRIRGIDLGVGGKITDQWSLYGGLVLMQSEILKSNAPPSNTQLFTTNVGARLANVAHQSFNILTKYKFNRMWEVGGQATYVSKIYGGTLAATVGTELPAHWRFDAFLEAKLTDEITAKVSVNNIFDTVYYDGFYRSAAPFVLIAPGRSAQLSLLAKF